MYFYNPLFSPTSLFFPVPFSFAADAQKCELICQSEGTGDVVFMNQVVHDGTRCSYRDPYSVCVRGECLVRSCCGTVPCPFPGQERAQPLRDTCFAPGDRACVQQRGWWSNGLGLRAVTLGWPKGCNPGLGCKHVTPGLSSRPPGASTSAVTRRLAP